ncbi:MAG: hypothetical protein M1834_001614 [Cirrosporium novae-zelandiae]|nr:MAG: hypothetical protein M1834_001614 [Cirrosporium novae-zelandiae]
MEKVDLIVIGTGWYGLASAKTYLQTNPSANVVVLEAAPTLGGVWAEHRLYPGVKSNNMVGTYEYSDFPMDEATYGVKPGQHIPGNILHQYLTDYAEKFGVLPRIRFQSKVETVEKKHDGGWLLTIKMCDENSKTQIMTQKLIVATGLASEPFLPDFKGKGKFDAPFFHCRDFLGHADTLKTARRVAVLGGTKSAWDDAYAYATENISVDLIVRESGHGPCWMAPPYVTPLRLWLEKLVHTRFLTWFSPCIWGDADGYGLIRRFFHGTTVGRWIVDRFWKILGGDVLSLMGYDKHPGTKKLKPWSDAFWTGSGLSILNYPTDFLGLVRDGKIKVHIADVESLAPRTVNLSNGLSLPADALVCSTGWKHHPPMTFLPPVTDAVLGLPHYSETSDKDLESRADDEILTRFPRLKAQPPSNPKYKPLPGSKTDPTAPAAPNQPYRLYHFMVPPSRIPDRDIAFAGAVSSITTSLCAQIQALWITAYFDGKLSKPPGDEDTVRWKTQLYSQFGRWRYPGGFGARFPDFVFDALPYLDMLLGDLGMNTRRKSGWFEEIFSAYGPEDYGDLVEEWKEGNGGKL